VSVEKQKQIE